MRCFYVLMAAVLTLLSGCASVRSYDMPGVQAELTRTVQSTDTIVQKAQGDYKEKVLLVDNLRKAGDPGFLEVESRMQRHLDVMKISLENMIRRRKIMADHSGRLAALGYAHSAIHSDDPEYDKVSDSVREFQTAAKDVNAAVLDYSRESNSLADLASQKKLYYNFDVKEFQSRVQQAIKSARANTETMKKELERSQALLNNWSRPDSRKASEEIYAKMGADAKEYTQKAAELSGISKQMHEASSGNAKVSTLDAGWPKVQAAIDALDRTVLELRETYERFQANHERFRSPAKRGPSPAPGS